MKIGGVEVAREKWDEATLVGDDEDDVNESTQGIDAGTAKRPKFCLPDWTRSSLPIGAPPAPRPPRPEAAAPQTPVDA